MKANLTLLIILTMPLLYLFSSCCSNAEASESQNALSKTETDAEIFLLEAACSNDTEAVISLFQAQPNLNPDIISDDGYYNPIICAAGLGNFDLVNILMEHGANPNSKNKDSWNPLACACRDGSYQMAEYLIEHGADINMQTSSASSALMFSCCSFEMTENADLINLLLERGADVNAKDEFGNSPMTFASMCNNLQAVRLITEAGGDIFHENNAGESALSIAEERWHHEIKSFLLDFY